MQNVNFIEDTQETGRPGTEPVSVPDMKRYLRLQGFIDDQDSTPVDEFTDDDRIISEDITTARMHLEQILGVSIIEHTYTAYGVRNDTGGVKLEFGPVTSIESAKDSDDEDYDVDNSDVVKRRGDTLILPRDCGMTIEYKTGYQNSKIPKPFITEVKRMVAYLYEHRGDEAGLEDYKLTPGIKAFSRRSFIE